MFGLGEIEVRVKSKWSNKGRERTLDETGGAVAFILWRIAQQGLLNLENEGFQTDTRSQRMDVIAEFLAFLYIWLIANRQKHWMRMSDRHLLPRWHGTWPTPCRRIALMQRGRAITAGH